MKRRFPASEQGAALLAVLAMVLLLVKFSILYLVGLHPGRLEPRSALMLAGVLWLGGEFAFVVFGEAVSAGLLADDIRDRLVAIVGLSMALTPLLLIVMV